MIQGIRDTYQRAKTLITTRAQIKRILELYWKEGKSLRAIENIEGVSHTTVWRIIQDNPPPASVRKTLEKFGPLLGET